MKNFNVMHAIAVYQKIFSITEDDRSIIPIPAYHVTGLVALLGLFFYSGGCLYLHKFFNAERVLKEVQEHRLTFIHASPTVFSMLLDHRKEYPGLPSVRILACGSSNMPGENIREFHRWMPQAEFRTIYGLTETTSPATIFPEGAALSRHLGSSGRPIPGLKFMICDEYQHTLGPRQVGSIYVEGTTVTTGYYKMSSDMYLDGFLDTGDLGYFDEDGYLYVVDRKKDMINRGGEKICSFDVENALYTIQEIREAAVVGIPDTRYGEVPAAMVVQKEGSTLSEDEIRKILNTHLAKFQIPVKFRFVESLPLTPNMKVDKRKIREIMSNDQN